MINGISTSARRLLINFGKILPFILCAIIAISYAETMFALATNDYLTYGNTIIPNTPLSFIVGDFFEYDVLVVIIAFILGIAIEACKWNLLTTFYLSVHLLEKAIFEQVELSQSVIVMIALTNLLACLYLLNKGKNILVKNS